MCCQGGGEATPGAVPPWARCGSGGGEPPDPRSAVSCWAAAVAAPYLAAHSASAARAPTACPAPRWLPLLLAE